MQDPDNLIINIGSAIVLDPKFRNLDWDSTAIIFEALDTGWSSHGYIFREDGSWEARTPKDDDFEIYDMTINLQSAMEQQDGKKWLKALVQIKRSDQSVNFTFEYDDYKRWEAGPNNFEEIAVEVKP